MQPNKMYSRHVRGASQHFVYFGEPQHVGLVGEQVGRCFEWEEDEGAYLT